MFLLFRRVLLIVIYTDNPNSSLSCCISSHMNLSPWNCRRPVGAVAVLSTLNVFSFPSPSPIWGLCPLPFSPVLTDVLA